MSLSSFLKLVEIRTKVASVIPFLLGSIYVLYSFSTFNLRNFIFMFISLIAFDMAVTAINNYYDYKKAEKTHGYSYEIHNAIVKDNLNEGAVVIVIVTLLIFATLFGILLFLNTTVVVLLLGMLSFLVGILYSFGPVPISRMPLGEIFSGFFMGFGIIFLSIYIHVFDQNIISLIYEKGMLTINMDMIEIVYIILFSLPAIIGIANIMLANNICDMDDDIENKRYTLPIYIGKEKALITFKILYYIIYIDLIVLLSLKLVPIISIVTLFTFIKLNKNIKGFHQKQTKKDTFVLAVQSFVLINVVLIFTMGISVLIKNVLTY